jgi:hypothetical protein
MTHHPHIHMIVPGGGLSPDGKRWVSSRPAFLLPVRVLGKLFRRLFLTRLMALYEAGRLGFFGSLAALGDRRAFLQHLSPVRKKNWVVYAKPPFTGPQAVLAYLSRYTHRVAILNSRLVHFDETGVTLRYKNYRNDVADRQQLMTLAADEFIRRFLIHVLPKGFHLIRHYGLLAGAPARLTSNTPANCSGSPRPWPQPHPSSPMMPDRHAHAAADACSSSRPSNAGASPAHRRMPPTRPGPPRHDPAWLALIQPRGLYAPGDDDAHAIDTGSERSVTSAARQRPDISA